MAGRSSTPPPSFDPARLLAALSQLPDGCASEIHAWHLLQKLAGDDQTALLKECRRVLAPGGIFAGAVPDMDVLCRLFVSLPDPTARMAIATLIYGDHSSPAHIHHFGFNWDILAIAFSYSGYRKLSLLAAPYLPDLPATLIEGIAVDLSFIVEA